MPGKTSQGKPVQRSRGPLNNGPSYLLTVLSSAKRGRSCLRSLRESCDPPLIKGKKCGHTTKQAVSKNHTATLIDIVFRATRMGATRSAVTPTGAFGLRDG